jgi:hypothetical protein
MSPEPGFGLIGPAFGFTSNSNNNRRGNPRQKSVRAGKYDNQWLVSDSPSEFAVAAVLREGRVEGVLARVCGIATEPALDQAGRSCGHLAT